LKLLKEDDNLQELKPVSIVAEGQNGPKSFSYRVFFEGDGVKSDFTFTVSDDEITSVYWDSDKFWDITREDPRMSALMQAILRLHDSRRSL